MGTITAIIIALLSIIVDPSGIKTNTGNGTVNNVIIVDPSGITSNTNAGSTSNVIIVDPSGLK